MWIRTWILTNDLPNSVTLLTAILLTDNATVYASSMSIHEIVNIANLEAQLEILGDRFRAKVSLNFRKTNDMYITFTTWKKITKLKEIINVIIQGGLTN